MKLSRRDLLKAGVFAGAATALPLQRFVSGADSLATRMPASKLPRPFSSTFRRPSVITPSISTATTDYYDITMRAAQVEILPGYQTVAYTYNGQVPGPTIRVDQGRQVVVRQANQLPAMHDRLGYEPWTSVHLHGSASLPQFDGYASDITRPGEFKDYQYPNAQPARTLWYHDHGVHHTAQNAYQGLAAMYLMSDPLERSLGLPSGEFDVPLMISDAMFHSDGQFLFSLDDESGMWGDVMLVNGVPWPTMDVKPRKYRFRVLNCSISRSLNWRLSNGAPFHVIATDGGLTAAPIQVTNIRHAGAERYEVVIDFAKYKPGTLIQLLNNSPKNNRDDTNTNRIMQFRVVSGSFPTADDNLPSVLNPNNPVMALEESQAVNRRRFRFERKNSQWTINGKTWKDVEDSGYRYTVAQPLKDSVEVWTLENSSGGWFHPVHIHLVDFKILDRNGRPPHPWERGPKDVAYVGENETVRVLVRFEGRGKYMMHCHNLVHEDHDMMAQFEVVDPSMPGDDPMGTPARPLDQMGPLGQ